MTPLSRLLEWKKNKTVARLWCAQNRRRKMGYLQGGTRVERPVGILKFEDFGWRFFIPGFGNSRFSQFERSHTTHTSVLCWKVPGTCELCRNSYWVRKIRTEPVWSRFNCAHCWWKKLNMCYTPISQKQSASKYDVWVKSLSLIFHSNKETHKLFLVYPFSWIVKQHI